MNLTKLGDGIEAIIFRIMNLISDFDMNLVKKCLSHVTNFIVSSFILLFLLKLNIIDNSLHAIIITVIYFWFQIYKEARDTELFSIIVLDHFIAITAIHYIFIFIKPDFDIGIISYIAIVTIFKIFAKGYMAMYLQAILKYMVFIVAIVFLSYAINEVTVGDLLIDGLNNIIYYLKV